MEAEEDVQLIDRERSVMYRSKDNKFRIWISPKTGTRSSLALCCLSYDPSLTERYPHWFEPKKVELEGQYVQLENFLFSKMDFKPSSFKYDVCIIRDPVDRFVSGYRNRILFHGELPYQEKPTFDYFINNLDDYFALYPRLARNFAPQVSSIGKDRSWFTHIIETKDLEQLFVLFEQEYERPFPRLKLQQGGSDIKVTVTEEHINLIKQRYREDYEIWFPHKL